MSVKVNKIRNPDFSSGRSKASSPAAWTWEGDSTHIRWSRRSSEDSDTQYPTGVVITSEKPTGTGLWSQIVTCKPEVFYRIEATVTCDLDGPGTGVVLAVTPAQPQPTGNTKRTPRFLSANRQTTPALRRSSKPVAIRTYFEARQDVRRLKIEVGIEGAKGSAEILHVRFIQIIEPEHACNPVSIPSPSYTMSPPSRIETIGVCAQDAAERPVTALLRKVMGDRKVRTLAPSEFRPDTLNTDAILFPDSTPPRAIRSYLALEKLASKHVVVMSLPAFAKLAGSSLSLKRIEQDDDPIHAKIFLANHATQGFALHDMFPWAWPGKEIGSFVQNQFRRTAAAKGFVNRHQLRPLLLSMCDRDATSERAVAFYKKIGSGELFVLDIEPAEQNGSTLGDSIPAVHLLLTLLGQTQSGLGQYTVPEEDEAHLRGIMREMQVRNASFVVHDDDVPNDEVTHQMVTVGRPDDTFGLPLQAKPVILIRTGLCSGEMAGTYAALLWIKQLIRAEPFPCPYAAQLASRFRFAWLPALTPWEARHGWQSSATKPNERMVVELDGGDMSALIDITECDENRVRVVIPNKHGRYQRYEQWLPQLFAACGPNSHWTFDAPEGEPNDDRDRFSWHRAKYSLEVVADASVFLDPIHQQVLDSGGEIVRIELPPCHGDFTNRSIQKTDLAATLLEQVIGIQYGLLALNRSRSPARIDGFAPVKPGECLMIEGSDPVLGSVSRTG